MPWKSGQIAGFERGQVVKTPPEGRRKRRTGEPLGLEPCPQGFWRMEGENPAAPRVWVQTIGEIGFDSG